MESRAWLPQPATWTRVLLGNRSLLPRLAPWSREQTRGTYVLLPRMEPWSRGSPWSHPALQRSLFADSRRHRAGSYQSPSTSEERRKCRLPVRYLAGRRSRRLAGLGVDTAEVCPVHLKKKVMRALDLDVEDEKEVLSQKILEEYAQRFCHGLAHPHSRALAAPFGWTPPEDDLAVGPVECLV